MILLYFIGSAALSSGNIKPRTIPDMANMSYVLKIRNQNISVPLNQPRKLWALREFNPRLPLVMVITGWTTNANDTNPALDVIWPAYRCRGNVNFVVSFQIKSIINNFQWIFLLIQRQFFAGTVIRLLTPVSFNSHHATEFILIFILFYFTFVDKADFVDTLYTWSAFNTEEIGKEIGESLAYLTKTYPIEKIHLIGECDTLKNSRYKSLPSKK